MKNTLDFSEINMKAIPETGGDVAALGEIFNHLTPEGIEVADGFAVTSSAYRRFMDYNGLADLAASALNRLDLAALSNLEETARDAMEKVAGAQMPQDLATDIADGRTRLLDRCPPGTLLTAHGRLLAGERDPKSRAGIAAVFREIPDESALLAACQRCFAAPFTPAALMESLERGPVRVNTVVSVSVQRQIGEAVRTLTDDEIRKLDSWHARIADHFGQLMDVEWIRHEATGKLFVVKAAPSRRP